MFTINEILKATGGQLISGRGQPKVSGVSIDSRQVKSGQVFIAVKGDIFDGHDFLSNVISQGIKVVIIHRLVTITDQNVNVILVKDTVRALGDLARFHRLRFKVPVITLTGSAGKTTTKEMIAAVLQKKYKVLKNEGTQNNHIGVPLTLLKLKTVHSMVVLECGTNQPGDIAWLADVARATVALFTNIGESHLERLKSPAGVLKEKWNLTSFLNAQSAIIANADDVLLVKAMRSAAVKARRVTYGIKHKASWQASRIQIIDGRNLEFYVAQKRLVIKSCGIVHVYNALAAYACGRLFNVRHEQIAAALAKFDFPQGRGQILPLGKGWLINDVYNANPLSMRAALQTLDAISTQGKKIFVAADMLELGPKSKDLHRSIGAAAAASSAQAIITVGDLAKSIAQEAKRKDKSKTVFVCDNSQEASKCLSGIFQNGDAVLVKGSRRMKMESVVEFLLASPQASLT